MALVAHWKLDDNAANTTVTDELATYGLTLNGGDNTSAKSVAAKDGNGFQFNGTDDYCSRTTAIGYRNGAYTIAAWVKGVAQSDTKIFGNGANPSTNNEFSIGTGATTTSKCRIRVRNNDGTYAIQAESTTTVFDDTWHHIAFVNDGDGNARLYVDGVEDATNFDYTHVDTSPNRTSIGAHLRSTAAGFFNGIIDDVRVYDNALSQSDVLALPGFTVSSGIYYYQYQS